MRFDHKTSLCFSGGVFAVLLFIGFLISQHKLLWIDECYTQHVSVDHPSYADILTLNFPDGNKCPLFYVLQKVNCNLFSFHYTGQAEGPHDLSNARSQIIIRIPSNIYMSLALAAIFYYFMRFFSLFTAIYVLAVALVSPMIWTYWVEARPYSLWFLLTSAQLLFFCSTIHAPKIKVNKLIFFSHILLVLTTPGSIVQVSIIALMLFFKKGYDKRQLLLVWLLPACIFLLYYFLVPVYKFKTFDFVSTIFEAVMPERLFVCVIYALTAWGFLKKEKVSSNTFFLPIFLLFLIAGCLVLFMDLFTVKSQFNFHSRYLIYLAPADILMFSFASFDMWQWARKNIWICMDLAILLGGLVVMRGLLTYREILATGLFLHSPG